MIQIEHPPSILYSFALYTTVPNYISCLKLHIYSILIIIDYKLSSHLGMMIIIFCIIPYDDKFDDSHNSKETDPNYNPNPNPNPKPKQTQP